MSEEEKNRTNKAFYKCCLDKAIGEPNESEMSIICNYTAHIDSYKPTTNDTVIGLPQAPKDLSILPCESNEKNVTECCRAKNVSEDCLEHCHGQSHRHSGNCPASENIAIIQCYQENAYPLAAPILPTLSPASNESTTLETTATTESSSNTSTSSSTTEDASSDTPQGNNGNFTKDDSNHTTLVPDDNGNDGLSTLIYVSTTTLKPPNDSAVANLPTLSIIFGVLSTLFAQAYVNFLH